MESVDIEFWYFSSLYTIVTALYIGAIITKARGSHDREYWTFALLALGGPLCFLALPGYRSLLFLTCSLWLCYVVLGRRVDMLTMHGRAVLITGCDTGFGHALARRISDLGVTVFAGVLDETSPGAVELKRLGSEGLQVLQLDVTDAAQIERAHHYICTQVGDADGEILPVRVYRNCLAVNFLAAVEVSQVFLPLLRHSRGRLVNVCSMAGDVPVPGFVAYGASKAALNTFSGVMRLELARWGVNVSTIQPAGFKTNIFGSSDDWSRYQEEIFTSLSQDVRKDYGEAYISSLQARFAKMAVMSSEDLRPVLDDMCHALMSVAPRPVYTPGQSAWLIPCLHRLCPTQFYDMIITSLFQFNSSLPAGLQAGASVGSKT
ncbi:17-beta-hydroxysteroid dehydrogenase type 2 isoform X2 [Oncorhynchus clarkii lewisi]|uniref:17-beta-hydroxysteroid dehydrogenase type 2 isoform X2 n=1 Tax=Oncorhynchus clarkii lewisi TaxID=490388 RepID=UPI0039B954A6